MVQMVITMISDATTFHIKGHQSPYYNPISPLVSLLFFFLLLGDRLQKRIGSVVSNEIEMKFSRNVPQVNIRRSVESYF